MGCAVTAAWQHGRIDDTAVMQRSMERNLWLIPLHEVLWRMSPWIPVFVLFTRGQFGLDGAIQLAGIYYLAVVVFEVPSGWASDRIGRVPTLRAVGIAWIAAALCWLLGEDSFVVVAIGQVLLALGYSCISGTDVTFHYDTLEALGRADEYADRQAAVASRGYVVAAVTVVASGALGLVDLRWPFVAAAIAAAVQLVVALRLTEPPRTSEAEPIVGQVSRCLAYLADVPLRWIFGYGVAMVVLEHVAFTLLQPWMTEALDATADDVESTPLVVGITMAVIAVIGAVAARSVVGIARRFGVRAVLVALGALSAGIVTTMAAAQHVAVLAVVVLRSAQGAAAPILISAAVAPVVAQQHRATLLSLNSLGGRLAWGGLLLVLSTDVDGDVAPVLWRFSAVSWALVVVIGATAIAVRRRHRAVGL